MKGLNDPEKKRKLWLDLLLLGEIKIIRLSTLEEKYLVVYRS